MDGANDPLIPLVSTKTHLISHCIISRTFFELIHHSEPRNEGTKRASFTYFSPTAQNQSSLAEFHFLVSGLCWSTIIPPSLHKFRHHFADTGSKSWRTAPHVWLYLAPSILALWSLSPFSRRTGSLLSPIPPCGSSHSPTSPDHSPRSMLYFGSSARPPSHSAAASKSVHAVLFQPRPKCCSYSSSPVYPSSPDCHLTFIVAHFLVTFLILLLFRPSMIVQII
ncbi:hypothetical protein BC827DRAFT_1240515 [Russula dissimulans]|jgi:hypothetical protein|nr:hypothetical protein BC827DRAFT_1240515 [Russula dissimulans]